MISSVSKLKELKSESREGGWSDGPVVKLSALFPASTSGGSQLPASPGPGDLHGPLGEPARTGCTETHVGAHMCTQIIG